MCVCVCVCVGAESSHSLILSVSVLLIRPGGLCLTGLILRLYLNPFESHSCIRYQVCVRMGCSTQAGKVRRRSDVRVREKDVDYFCIISIKQLDITSWRKTADCLVSSPECKIPRLWVGVQPELPSVFYNLGMRLNSWLSSSRQALKGFFWYFMKYIYLLSCQKLEDRYNSHKSAKTVFTPCWTNRKN